MTTIIICEGENNPIKQSHDLLKQLLFNQNLIISKLNKMANELQALKDQVAASITVEESAIALITGLKTELDAAIAANDPAALQALSDSLGAEKDKLAAAVTANTPAAQPAQ